MSSDGLDRNQKLKGKVRQGRTQLPLTNAILHSQRLECNGENGNHKAKGKRHKAYGKVLTMTMPSRSILNVMVERHWGWQGQGQNGLGEVGALNHD